MTATRSESAVTPRALSWALLSGLLAGVVAKAADESGLSWAADLGSYPAAWVLAVALVGRTAPTVGAAAVRAAVFFAAMTLAYYAWAAWVLGFGWSPLLPAWLVLSATAVAATAAGCWWATRRAGLLPGAVVALTAGVTLAGGEAAALLWTLTGGAGPGFRTAHPVQGWVDAVVAVVLVAVLPRSGRTRLWALVLLAPATWLAARGLEVLAQLLG
ncbi:DUF6518 family protein [Geodermatophilus sp. SYSU D00708]